MQKIILLSVLFLFFAFPFKGFPNEFTTADNYRLVIIDEYSAEEIISLATDLEKDQKYIRIGKHIFKNPFCRPHQKKNKNKFTTIVVILLTGPLGGHRLYLGTSPVVPVVYAITLGGGIGILPVIDLIVIATTKDINRYINNDKVIMWVE
ncbi:MAG: TM2 domain-containing protein [Bacteroidia bacterium]|nr:TM2 domain-containing protein [Bacteroidia bacterium]